MPRSRHFADDHDEEVRWTETDNLRLFKSAEVKKAVLSKCRKRDKNSFKRVAALSSSGGLGLSRLEIERTFEKLAQRAPALPGAAAPQRLQLQTLEASMRAVPESLAEAQWVRDLTTNVASRAQQSGALLEASFARLGQEAIDAEEVRKEFAKHLSMDSEQWKTVVCFLQKQSDGCVFWREFLRWAGVVKGF
ncbi:unnamed protein product [Polarella glacialis]|uniref:Uncharacterized protein n=1 Tax=Polarella glacialis TaxID=89957 RepID=A0A813E3U6_POLGL|nr:unnamed protein product [Polarella glacialis]